MRFRILCRGGAIRMAYDLPCCILWPSPTERRYTASIVDGGLVVML